MNKKQTQKAKSEFQARVYSFFEDRYIGRILKLEPTGANRHYIKFKPLGSVWFQEFSTRIEVDSVDFDKNTISGFINDSSKL